jgi:hypothetical protein
MSQERKKYRILTFNVRSICESLFSHENDMCLSENETEEALVQKLDGSDRQYESPLFRQIILQKIQKEHPEPLDFETTLTAFENDGLVSEDLLDLLVFFDFSGIFDTGKSVSDCYADTIRRIFKEGISLTIKTVSGPKVGRYLPFENSGGQRRFSVLSFLRDDYEKETHLRIMMGMPLIGQKRVLSKLFAYNGLMMSDGYRIEDPALRLNEESLVIIPDSEQRTRATYTTAFRHQDAVGFLRDYLAAALRLSAKCYGPLIADFFGDKTPEDAPENLIRSVILPARLKAVGSAYAVYRKMARESDEDHAAIIEKSVEGFVSRFAEIPANKHWQEWIQPSKEFAQSGLTLFAEAVQNFALNCDQELLASFPQEKLPGTWEEEWHLITIDGPVSYKLFDGEGLVLPEITRIINHHYSSHQGQGQDHTSFQIRMPYMKGMIHTADFLAFFGEHHELFIPEESEEKRGISLAKPFVRNAGSPVYFLIDCFGIPRDVSKIKILLTSGQFKGAKWLQEFLESLPSGEQKAYETRSAIGAPTLDVMKYYFERFASYHHALYISQSNKLDKPDNAMTRLNYQFLSTCGLDQKGIETIFEGRNSAKSINAKRYQDLVNNEEEQVKCLSGDNDADEEALEEVQDGNGETLSLSPNQMSKIAKEEERHVNQALAVAITKNPALLKDPFLAKKLKDVAESYLSDMARSRLEIGGENRYLCSDLLHLLYHALAADSVYLSQEERLRLSEFYAPEKTEQLFPGNPGIVFSEKKGCSILRNPHIVPNEDGFLFPWRYCHDLSKERCRYFHELTGVVMVNPTSLIPDRLGGADYDGDMVKLIADDVYNQAVAKHFRLAWDEKANPPRPIVAEAKTGFELVKIPSAKATGRAYTPEAACETVLNSFAGRVGDYCNKAFTYSNFAFSQMDGPITDLEILRKKAAGADLAKLYLIIIGLEIDAAKNGERPLEPAPLSEYKNFDLGASQFIASKFYAKIKNKTGGDAKKAKADAKKKRNAEIANKYGLSLPLVPLVYQRCQQLHKEFHFPSQPRISGEKVFPFEEEYQGQAYQNFPVEFLEKGADPTKMRRLFNLLLAYKELRMRGQRLLRSEECSTISAQRSLIREISYSIYGENKEYLAVNSLNCIEEMRSLPSLYDLQKKIRDEHWQYHVKTSKNDERSKFLDAEVFPPLLEGEARQSVGDYLSQFWGTGSKLLPLFVSQAIDEALSDDQDEDETKDGRQAAFDFLVKALAKSIKKTEDESSGMALAYKQEVLGRDQRILRRLGAMETGDKAYADLISEFFDDLEAYFHSGKRDKLLPNLVKEAEKISGKSILLSSLKSGLDQEEPNAILSRLYPGILLSPSALKAAQNYAYQSRFGQSLPEPLASESLRPDSNEIARLLQGKILPLPGLMAGENLSDYTFRLNFALKNQLATIFETPYPNENEEALVYIWALHCHPRYSSYVTSDVLWTVLIGAIAKEVRPAEKRTCHA